MESNLSLRIPLRKHIEKAIKDFQIHTHEKLLDVGIIIKTIIQKKVEY